MMRGWVAAMWLVAGCGATARPPDAAVSDAGGGPADLGVVLDGGGLLSGNFTVTGCADLSAPGGMPVCSGPAPLELTFVPFGSGLTTYLWTFSDGGAPGASKETSP